MADHPWLHEEEELAALERQRSYQGMVNAGLMSKAELGVQAHIQSTEAYVGRSSKEDLLAAVITQPLLPDGNRTVIASMALVSFREPFQKEHRLLLVDVLRLPAP